MALNSINTNIAAYYAQQNIGKASNSASSSIARLSSGNRIVRAADDVAAVSAGTSLRTNVTTLRTALINTSQASSLLQVADGALSQVTDILQRQKAIAVQAGSGSLTASERTFLNQEFQNLTQEIDRLAENTNFNGVKLLTGILSETVNVSNVSTSSAAASASITFSANIFAGSDLVLNGTTVTEGTNYTRGATIQDTLDAAVTFLNGSTDANLSKATYSRQGNSLVITARAGGAIGETFTINSDLATSTALSVTGAAAGARIGTVNGKFSSKITDTVTGILVANTNVTSAATAATTLGYFKVGDAIKGQDNADAAATLYTVLANDTLDDIVAGVNANTLTSGVSARIDGYSGNYSIVFERNYNNANETSADLDIAITTAATVAAAGADVLYNVASLDGATDVGLGYGRTSATGLVGNDVLTAQNQTKAKITLTFPEIASADLLTAANFGTQRSVTIDGVDFGFITGTPAVGTEVEIGASLSETLDNLVSAINSYAGYGNKDFSFNQIEARREGTNVILERKSVGDANDTAATAVAVTLSGPTGSSALGTFSNGSDAGGVSTAAVTNKDFVGKIGGLTATFNGTNDTVNLSITVGSKTYAAIGVDTTPAANATVRLISQDGGGYFDIQLASGQGTAVSSQANANTFANRINAALSGLTFSQTRSVSSYQGVDPILTNGVVTGSLIGTSVDIQQSDFSAVQINDVQVLAPSGSSTNGSIRVTVNGEVYATSPDIGSTLGANGVTRLTSAVDSSRFIEFRTGSTAIEFDTTAKASAFEDALKEAFGVGEGAAALQFQVGVTTTDTLKVSISGVSTDTIYGGATLNVLTQGGASAADTVLSEAIKKVTSVRAEVGALQSRFDFAAANVQSSIQNQDAARGVLLDTDIAAESTSYATAQVQLQAGISVLAQANQLQQTLLKLIG